VIADLPLDSKAMLSPAASIASTGARCGVYTLSSAIRARRFVRRASDELESHSLNLIRQGDRFIWKDEVFKQFPSPRSPPAEDFLTAFSTWLAAR